MKRVLLISSPVPHYRVSIYNHFFQCFLAKGWEFSVASSNIQSDNQLPRRFEFHSLPGRFLAYRRFIREWKPDVVIFHMLIKDRLFWWLIHWLKLRGTPVICWTKGANLDKPQTRMRFELFNHFHDLSDALILYSAAQISLLKPRNRKKVFVANNTVNFNDYPEVLESKEEIRQAFDIPFSHVVLFAGTMGIDGERKKVDHLIEVFRRMERPDMGLVLVGGGMTEERKSRLNPRNTLYLGKVHDPDNRRISMLFKAADVFCIPGHVGLGLNQAFYWGVPVVTEDGLHPPEIQYLKPGRNGFMVPENDLDALREKIEYLVDHEEVRINFGRAAREDIIREASIDGMFMSFWRAVQYATGTDLTSLASSTDAVEAAS